jgi:hypothetical protein
MTVTTRLLAFAGVLALLFTGAAVAGGQVDIDRGKDTTQESHQMTPMTETDDVRGLAVAEDGLRLQLLTPTAKAGRRFDLALRIEGRDGATLRDFDVEHTKRMHVIVVRRDLTGFQHVHPVQRPDGTWTVPVTLDEPGTYRVFADFQADGEKYTLGSDLEVDGAVSNVALPAPSPTVSVDGYQVTLEAGAATAGEEADLRFSVTRDGRPVAVRPYLGALGHLVALREGDLAFLHVHPDEDELRFMAEFPSEGRYRLFLQFETETGVHTAAFTQEVSR